MAEKGGDFGADSPIKWTDGPSIAVIILIGQAYTDSAHFLCNF